MLACYDNLPEEMQEAFAFINDYESLLQELMAALDAIRHIEYICKNKGFSFKTSKECQSYIVAPVIGNAYPRQAHLGLKIPEYFRKEEAQLTEDMNICISSNIIESTFGIYKGKKSQNKLYGITSFALTIPLYPKIVNESVTKTFNFKERLVNVKLKDIDAWAIEYLSKNWVTERTKTLKQVSLYWNIELDILITIILFLFHSSFLNPVPTLPTKMFSNIFLSSDIFPLFA